jgi:photosystem II stability/assembly factor-like uncharacterized protein
MATSPDGITWTKNSSSFGSTDVTGVVYGTKFVAVSFGGQIGVSTTGNGTSTWGSRTSPNATDKTAWNAVGYDGSGLYVAVGNNGTLATSPDGDTWTARTSQVLPLHLRCVGFDGTRWFAGGDDGVYTTSLDGITWTSGLSPIGDILAFAQSGGVWMITGQDGRLATSSDNGDTWVQRLTPFTDTRIVALATDGSRWLIATEDGRMATSDDLGVTWTERTSSFGTTAIRAVVFANGTWMATGDVTLGALPDGRAKIASSPDGVTWTQRNTVPVGPNNRGGLCLTYSSGLSRWVVGGTQGQFFYSNDNGLTWASTDNNAFVNEQGVLAITAGPVAVQDVTPDVASPTHDTVTTEGDPNTVDPTNSSGATTAQDRVTGQNYTWNPEVEVWEPTGTVGLAIPNLTWGETPAGAIDSANATFTLAAAPNPALSLILAKNGMIQKAGDDFTLSGLTITFVAGNIPQTGDALVACVYAHL